MPSELQEAKRSRSIRLADDGELTVDQHAVETAQKNVPKTKRKRGSQPSLHGRLFKIDLGLFVLINLVSLMLIGVSPDLSIFIAYIGYPICYLMSIVVSASFFRWLFDTINLPIFRWLVVRMSMSILLTLVAMTVTFVAMSMCFVYLLVSSGINLNYSG